ncbi:MucBP domain-containing protein [Leifsonia xyli]|uniref:MucBP domain-containing protein n=1 Tax=Leifsonia xyli TaxID=1575 RepID=UPI003D6760DD
MTHLSARLRVTIATALAASAIVLAQVAPASAAPPAPAPTPTPVAASAIIDGAVAEAKGQAALADYTAPIVTPHRKMLFLVMTDVTYTAWNRVQKMDPNERTYSKTVIDQFVSIFATKFGVQVDPTLVYDDEPFTTPFADVAVHEWQIQDRLAKFSGPAEFDSIMVFSKQPSGGGVTLGKYYSDSDTRGAGYSWSGLAPRANLPGYPGATGAVEYSTEIALHEFGHQMSFTGLGFPYPNLHAASSYGYTQDPSIGWTPFYLDYLTGKVMVNGRPQGAFPKMWPISQRFLHAPAMLTVHYVDAKGHTVAPDVNAYGTAGDAYALTAPALDGLGTPGVSSNGAPATGTWVANARLDVTFVYPNGKKGGSPATPPGLAKRNAG